MRSVSPIAAILLLILMSLAISSAVYIFVLGPVKSVNLTKEVREKARLTGVLLKIESIDEIDGCVYLRNVGSVKFNLSSLQLYVDSVPLRCNSSEVVKPGEVKGCCNPHVKACMRVAISYPGGFEEQNCNEINRGLVLFLSFDEGNGDEAEDKIRGLSVNVDGNWVSGISGYAYRFRGSGWVWTRFDKAIGKAISYVFWFRLPDLTDLQGTFLCTEDHEDYRLEDNLGQRSYGDTGCYGNWRDPSLWANDTNWHFFAFVKSGNSTLCLDDKCSRVGDATANVPNIKRIEFNGGCGCGYANFEQGIEIDELRIYSRELSIDEIKELYSRYSS